MGLYQVSVLFFYTVFAMTSDNVLNLSSVQNVTAKLNFQVGAVSSDYLQECRNPHASSYPCLKTSSKTWANPSLSWVASKECLPEGPQLFPSSAGVYGYCSSAEDVRKTDLPAEVGAGQSDAVPRRFHNHKSKTKEAWKFQSDRAVKARPGLHGDPVQKIKMPSATGVKPDLVTEKPPPQESGMSQVPLKLQIKVSGQRGTLGISIAGGKGSLPYKDHDEGIFISRVTKGGASEKAGICVGDRLVEVNGLNMQGATHHEAVSALRNAGSCIKMKVLRERPVAPEVCDLERPQDPVMGPHLCSQDGVGHRGKQSQTEGAEDRWLKKVERVVCNGNSIVDLKSDQRKTLSDLEMAVLTEMDSLQAGKHTMTIPRIILTHPSTSDEDVELLTQIPSRERLQRFPDRRVYPDCFDSAFYPP